VRHPELISCSLNGREMVVHDEAGMHLLEMLLVAEITRTLAESTTVDGNGG